LSDARHEGNATLAGYLIHALVGDAILLLTLLRMFFRRQDGTPAPASSGVMDKAATGIHHLLYTLLILLPVSGTLIVLTSKVWDALMAGDAGLLPKKFTGVLAHDVHELLVNVLIAVVIVHILGAAKHQFVLKDGLMSRMSLRRKD
jgi:cytochrome b561